MDFKDTYRIFGDCPEETALHCNNHRILTEYGISFSDFRRLLREDHCDI